MEPIRLYTLAADVAHLVQAVPRALHPVSFAGTQQVIDLTAQFPDAGGVFTPALCGVTPTTDDGKTYAWYGDGSDDEREVASGLPLCPACSP